MMCNDCDALGSHQKPDVRGYLVDEDPMLMLGYSALLYCMGKRGGRSGWLSATEGGGGENPDKIGLD